MQVPRILFSVLTLGVVAFAVAPSVATWISRHSSEEAISKVGAARLVAEVAALKEKAPALLALGPGPVSVSQEGVFVQRWRLFVWEQGVFIAFPGVTVSSRGDPSFQQIAPGVYWYEIKG